jgi:hypothetical protein
LAERDDEDKRVLKGDIIRPGYVRTIAVTYVLEKLAQYADKNPSFSFFKLGRSDSEDGPVDDHIIDCDISKVVMSVHKEGQAYYFVPIITDSKIGNQQSLKKYASVLKERHIIPFEKRYGLEYSGVINFLVGNALSGSDLDVISRNVRNMKTVHLPFDANELKRKYDKKMYQVTQNRPRFSFRRATIY